MEQSSFFNKPADEVIKSISPYKDTSANLIYNLLFCDNLELYQNSMKPPCSYPFDILFSETSSVSDLQKIIDDSSSDTRLVALAYNKQIALGQESIEQELLGVIVEIGMENGLDVLASFSDGTARYINHSEKILIWETTDDESEELTDDLFTKSEEILDNIGVWDQPRLPAPIKGNARITLLVSDGLYFGEGPIETLFNDPLASPALISTTLLMKYLVEKSMESN